MSYPTPKESEKMKPSVYHVECLVCGRKGSSEEGLRKYCRRPADCPGSLGFPWQFRPLKQ